MNTRSALTSYPSLLSRTVAAPSWVTPGTVRDNALFLAGKVHEVGLCFFETHSCLAYGADDLPPACPEALAGLSLRWHVHLPSDLPWNMSGAEAARYALELMDKVNYLGATRAVVHPPVGVPDAPARLEAFVAAWRHAGRDPADLLFENIHGEDLVALAPVLVALGCNVCLDLGHLLAYGQHGMFCVPSLMERVAMLHANAPGPGGRHLPLTALDAEGRQVARAVCARLSPAATIMVEVFQWQGVLDSLPLLDRWLGEASVADHSHAHACNGRM